MRNYGQFQIFQGNSASAVLVAYKKSAFLKINGEEEDYILNVNKDEYIEHLVDEYSVRPLELHKDQLFVSTTTEEIPAEHHPGGYMMDRGTSYPRDVIVYHLPFTGDHGLLKITPSTHILSAPMVSIEANAICFKIINFNYSADQITKNSEDVIGTIETQNNYLKNDIDQYNSTLEQQISQAFDVRKTKILEKSDLLSQLKVPIRRSSAASSTFAVPTKRTPVISSKPKPSVVEKGFAPEPALDEKIYSQILKIIHDVGKQFERHPSTYAGKNEEHLRDNFLLILEPNFEGSATGETFNKKGKTDILLRHEGENVFIAELKYWNGPKGLLKTIDQLLGYLTWRDSKAAVVMFVPNADFSAVLESTKESVPAHANYQAFIEEKGEGWYLYRFHINGDESRKVMLSVMLFHLPEQ